MYHLTIKFNGCELKTPDTVFYMKGKAVLIVLTDKDEYLISIRNPAKLTNNQIRNDLSSLIIKRKRAEEALKQNKNMGGVSIFKNSGKGIVIF